jgi:hypothetical protein
MSETRKIFSSSFYLVCIVCVEICDNVAGVHRVDIQVVVVIIIVVDIIVYIQDQGENSGRECGKVQSLSCRKRKLNSKYSSLKRCQSNEFFNYVNSDLLIDF